MLVKNKNMAPPSNAQSASADYRGKFRCYQQKTDESPVLKVLYFPQILILR